jgi:hypothetical protein
MITRVRRRLRSAVGRGGSGGGMPTSKPPTKRPRRTPPQCPAGWQVGPPDFVIVGAEKAGTTRWMRLVSEHPDVYLEQGRREIHFWDHMAGRWPTQADFDRYHRFFPRPPGGITGEKTPQYMNLWWIPRMLAEAAPDARIIVILRDPIERYLSGRTQGEKPRAAAVARGMTDSKFTQLAVINAMHRGQYALQLEWLMDAYPREQILVLQHEQCIEATLPMLARTYEFLGIAPFAPDPALLEQEINTAKTDKVPLEPERRELLLRLYRPQVKRLKEMVPDLDLSLWRNFADLEG